MKAFRFKGVLQKDGWLMPAYVRFDEEGNILEVSDEKNSAFNYSNINGFALPGLQNAHSHAFQYAMVGLTEQHDLKNNDDFWAWRKAMYQLALSVNPDQMEAIASMLYAEMLRHGYTEVAEFHYVHHQPSGTPYLNKAELGERLVAAAKNVGIKITLIPIFYQKGGFGKTATENYQLAKMAIGVHSLRAVEPTLVKALIDQLGTNLPFHIHVSEQLKEVEASMAYLGKRPVEWMLENLPLSDKFHLVHATHLVRVQKVI